MQIGIGIGLQFPNGSGPPVPPNTLIAGRGVFFLTGDTMVDAFSFGASQGAFALTGEAAAFSQGTVPVLTAGQGSFTLTGEAATLLGANAIGASQGAFALTGEAAGLKISMPAAQGSFTLTGEAATLTASGSNNIAFNAAGSLGGGGTSSGSSTTITTTVANCIIVVFNLSNANPPSGITDTAGLTWTPFATQTLKTGLWWALKPTAGATTITTSLGGSQFNVVHSVAFSGVKTTSPVDPSGSLPAYTSSSTPVTISPSNANDVLLAGYVTGGSATAGSGWTMVPGSGANFDLFEYQIVTSASPVSASITGTISSGIGSALEST